MPPRTTAGRKHEHPPPKVFSPPERSFNQPNSFAPTTRADLILSAHRSRGTPLKHTNVQRLELSNQSTQPAPSPELPSQYSSTYSPPSNVNYGYQKSPQLPPIDSGVLSFDSVLPGDHLPASSIERPYSLPPAYRSTYSPTQIQFAIANEFSQGDNQNTSFQLPSASGSSQPLPQAQLDALSHESSLPIRCLPNVPNSNQYSSSSELRSHDRRKTSLSGPPLPQAQLDALSHESSLTIRYSPNFPNPNQYSSSSKLRPHNRRRTSLSCPSPSTSTPNRTLQHSAPPSTNDFSSGRRSSNISPVSPIAHSPNQTNHPDIWSDEVALELSDDYKRKVPDASPEIFVFPPGRSAAHPEKSSKPKYTKSSIRSSRSSDDSSGGLRIFKEIFKKKSKGKNTPPESRIADESSYEFIVHHERTRTLKSGYPLDPYNSVLLDNDRHTGELLSRLNRTRSPSFHDYATPPSSVLDLGCGQGHWVLEAAIAWEANGTHVTGFDKVDISSNLLPRAPESVRNNIRFEKGNFLKELPFNNDTFDLVRMSCLGLCITLDSWGFILREVCRVLVVGGRLEFIDDQIFLPFGKESTLMEGHDEGPDHYAVGVNIHDPTGGAREQLNPSIVQSPEAWDRSLSISDLDALFERMLLDTFDIYKDPSDIVFPLMTKIFGQAQEVETMNLVLAPPNSTSMSGLSPQQGPSHCPGLILWPSTLFCMDHSEVEIHASKHLRTLLSCKNFLTEYAIKVAELEGEKFDEESVSQALWKYESFLRHRFNPSVPASGSSVTPNELIHVRTFRVFEAVKEKKNWA